MAFKEKKSQIRAEKSTNSDSTRRSKTNPLVYAGTIFILVIVIIAFVFPSFLSSGQQGVDLTFGAYDKIPISYVPGNYFSQYLEMMSYYGQNPYGQNPNDMNSYMTWRMAFDATVTRTAVLQEMKKAGYIAPVKIIDRAVALQFQENGRFSPALYDRLSRNEQLALRRRTQEDIAAGHFHSDYTGMLQPKAAGDFMAQMASSRRSFDMVSFSIENYPDTGLTAYAQENADLFRVIHLSRITVASGEREANQILASIKDGTSTFEDAAANHSQDSYASNGGDMGVKRAHELAAEIPDEAAREKIIALEEGAFSDVIKIDTGWAFFRVEEAAQPVDVSDPAALENIRSYVQTFERGKMEDWAFEQANNFITQAKESGFDAALIQGGLTKQSFGPIPLNYGNVDLFDSLSGVSISELSASASDTSFWKTAFTTPVNSVSEPLVQGSNVLVFFPTAEEQADDAALETIKSNYSSYWIGQKNDQSLSSYFLKSDKMEDRFIETYFRYLTPQPQSE